MSGREHALPVSARPHSRSNRNLRRTALPGPTTLQDPFIVRPRPEVEALQARAASNRYRVCPVELVELGEAGLSLKSR
jgi:hypothetical protein